MSGRVSPFVGVFGGLGLVGLGFAGLAGFTGFIGFAGFGSGLGLGGLGVFLFHHAGLGKCGRFLKYSRANEVSLSYTRSLSDRLSPCVVSGPDCQSVCSRPVGREGVATIIGLRAGTVGRVGVFALGLLGAGLAATGLLVVGFG